MNNTYETKLLKKKNWPKCEFLEKKWRTKIDKKKSWEIKSEFCKKLKIKNIIY